MTRSAASKPRRRGMRIAFQLLGFVLGLALLAWCIAGALSESNRAQLAKLGDASFAAVAGLIFLCIASLACNGAIFWCAIRPVRKLNALDVQATNAVGTLLAYAPFKLSLLFRILIHTRRDGVPLLMVGGWFAAVAIGITAGTLPLFVTSLVLGRVTPIFAASVLGGLLVLHLVIWRLSAVFAREKGLALLQRLADRLTPSVIARFTRSGSFVNLHAAFDMLSHPWYLALQMVLRAVDLCLLSARLLLAASVLGVSISASQSVIYAAVHFALGALSPTGALGTREGVTAGLASVIDPALADQLKLVLLVVLAVESAVTLGAAALGLVRLRPDRLLRAARPPS